MTLMKNKSSPQNIPFVKHRFKMLNEMLNERRQPTSFIPQLQGILNSMLWAIPSVTHEFARRMSKNRDRERSARVPGWIEEKTNRKADAMPRWTNELTKKKGDKEREEGKQKEPTEYCNILTTLPAILTSRTSEKALCHRLLFHGRSADSLHIVPSPL